MHSLIATVSSFRRKSNGVYTLKNWLNFSYNWHLKLKNTLKTKKFSGNTELLPKTSTPNPSDISFSISETTKSKRSSRKKSPRTVLNLFEICKTFKMMKLPLKSLLVVSTLWSKTSVRKSEKNLKLFGRVIKPSSILSESI